MGGLNVPQNTGVDSLFALGTNSTFADNPSPIKGKEFTKSFMTPITPSVVLFLIQNGWPVDLIMPLTVDSINGLRSQVSEGSNQRLGVPEFYDIITLLRQLQQADDAGIPIERTVKKEGEVGEGVTTLSIQLRKISAELKESMKKIDELLDLRPDLEKIKVSYGLIPDDDSDDKIVMITRSMLAILIQLAYQVDIPEEHVLLGSIVHSVEPSRYLGTDMGKLLEVKHSTTRPEHAYSSVKYRDLWFWIDDHDFKSKRTFMFVMILFSLLETGGTEGLTLITIET